MQGNSATFGLLTDGYDFGTQTWSYDMTFTQVITGEVIHTAQGTESDLVVQVPFLFEESQADFDAWLATQTITETFDPAYSKCVAQFASAAPFADEKRSLTIAHNCDASLSLSLTFSSFTGEFLTDSNDHGVGCSIVDSSLICDLQIAQGASAFFGLLTDGYDFDGEAWTYQATFKSLADNSEIFSTSGSNDDRVVFMPVPLSDFQSSFNSWSSSQSVAPGSYDASEIKCAARFVNATPFGDHRSAWLVTHDCESTLMVSVTFGAFEGDFLTNHSTNDCVIQGSDLVCTLVIESGAANSYGILADGVALTTWSHTSSFVSGSTTVQSFSGD